MAKLIRARLRGEKLPPFHYFDKGNLATIGRGAAVADLNWLRLSGWPAWLIWVFVHLLYIVQFQNRLLVLLQWAWLYHHFRSLGATDHREESSAAGFVNHSAGVSAARTRPARIAFSSAAWSRSVWSAYVTANSPIASSNLAFLPR